MKSKEISANEATAELCLLGGERLVCILKRICIAMS